MNFLGCAYPLFFTFLKFSLIFLVIFFLITGIYGFVKNSLGNNCDEKYHQCSVNEIMQFSYFNNAYKDTDSAFVILNIVATVVLTVFTWNFRRYHELTEDELDRSLLSPSDFTFMVEKIPLFEKESDIKSFFEHYSQAFKINVLKINKAYQIGDYVYLKRKKEELSKKQAEVISKSDNKKILQIEELQRKIEIMEKEFEEIENKFTGVAFVTVATEKGFFIFLLSFQG